MQAAAPFQLVRATEADIPFIMETERLEEYDRLVGRWDEARHAAALNDGRHAYFVAHASDDRLGFAIVRDWASPEGAAMIKRVAVRQPGKGIGRALLAALADLVFEQTSVYRLWLGVFPENLRARRAYEACGFIAEGVARGSAYFGGEHRDELVMALLRPEWVARKQGGRRG
jgi:RimJ/RimL family protein N-acetyltransferase